MELKSVAQGSAALRARGGYRNYLKKNISPTHKRTERRAPVWGSELTTKVATLQGDSEKIAPTLNVKLRVLVVVACYPFSGTAEPNPLFESIWTFENNFLSSAYSRIA
jgi:hypothetical protein